MNQEGFGEEVTFFLIFIYLSWEGVKGERESSSGLPTKHRAKLGA